jgi:hypothetical protein
MKLFLFLLLKRIRLRKLLLKKIKNTSKDILTKVKLVLPTLIAAYHLKNNHNVLNNESKLKLLTFSKIYYLETAIEEK